MTLAFVDDSYCFRFNDALMACTVRVGTEIRTWVNPPHKAWVYLELGSKIILTTLGNMQVL